MSDTTENYTPRGGKLIASFTLDLTPKWADVLPILLEGVRDNHRCADACIELNRMAEAADRWNAAAPVARAAPDLLEACKALLDAQSARRHPLGAPDEGIATLCVEAASKARA